MPLETRPFDASEYLDDAESIAAYLADAFESGSAEEIGDALGVVAKAKGMSELARQTGLSRQSLYKALSAEGHPEFATVLKVLQAVGVKLTPVPAPALAKV